MTLRLGLFVQAGLLLAAPLWSQEPAEPPVIIQQSGPDVLVGGGVLVGFPVGEFDEHVGAGGGVAGHAVLAIPDTPFALRIQASGLIYGSETIHSPLSETVGRVWVDVTTQNWIGHLGVGPQVMVRSGPVRPYAHAFLGVSYFSTTSEVASEDDYEPFARSTNFDDVTFAYGFGGGFLVPLGPRGLTLDLGVRYLSNGRVRFLAEGDVVDEGMGEVSLHPRHSEANLVELVVGVSFEL